MSRIWATNENSSVRHTSHGQRTKSGQCASYQEVQDTASLLLSKTSHRPRIGIICGSGLGGLVNILGNTFSIKYDQVPHFPVSTAPGHAGQLVFGDLGGKSCVCMQGRTHLYEGYPAWQVAFPVRVMHAMGVEILLVTNASGGLNKNYKVGDIMVLMDHINIPGMAGNNPLLGPNDDRFGTRYPKMRDAYDRDLRKIALETAETLGFDFVHKGVYAVQTGPCYETVAECRMLQLLGADVVGMSTVPEVMVARHCGMRCFAMSLVTNMCILDFESLEVADSDEVIEMGKHRSQDCQRFISHIVGSIELKSE